MTDTYTPDDQVAGVADPMTATTNLAYDVDRHLTQIADPNAITQTLRYNSAGQPARCSVSATRGRSTS